MECMHADDVILGDCASCGAQSSQHPTRQGNTDVGFEWLGVHFDIYRRSRVAILPLIQVPVVAKILQTQSKHSY